MGPFLATFFLAAALAAAGPTAPTTVAPPTSPLGGGGGATTPPKTPSNTECKTITVASNDRSKAAQLERQQRQCCLRVYKSKGVGRKVEVAKGGDSKTYISCNKTTADSCSFKDPDGKYRNCGSTADKSGAGPAETAPPKEASPAPKSPAAPTPSPAPSPSPSPTPQAPGAIQPGGYFSPPTTPTTNPTGESPTGGGGLESFSSGPSYQQILDQEIGAAMGRAKDLYKRLSGGYAYVGPKGSPGYADALAGGRRQILSPASGFKGREGRGEEDSASDDSSPVDSFLSFLGLSRFRNPREDAAPRRDDEVLALLHRYAATDSLSSSIDIGRPISIENLDFSIQDPAPAVQPIIASGIVPLNAGEQSAWVRTSRYFVTTGVSLFNHSVVEAAGFFERLARAARDVWESLWRH